MSLLSPSVERLNEIKKNYKETEVAKPIAANSDKEKEKDNKSDLLKVEKAAKLNPNYLLS